MRSEVVPEAEFEDALPDLEDRSTKDVGILDRGAAQCFLKRRGVRTLGISNLEGQRPVWIRSAERRDGMVEKIESGQAESGGQSSIGHDRRT